LAGFHLFQSTVARPSFFDVHKSLRSGGTNRTKAPQPAWARCRAARWLWCPLPRVVNDDGLRLRRKAQDFRSTARDRSVLMQVVAAGAGDCLPSRCASCEVGTVSSLLVVGVPARSTIAALRCRADMASLVRVRGFVLPPPPLMPPETNMVIDNPPPPDFTLPLISRDIISWKYHKLKTAPRWPQNPGAFGSSSLLTAATSAGCGCGRYAESEWNFPDGENPHDGRLQLAFSALLGHR